MSRLVGMLLHTALTAAGHAEFVRWETSFDYLADRILVRFDTEDRVKCVDFRIPNHIFDPVEYAKAEWPEWFTPKGQLEFNFNYSK